MPDTIAILNRKGGCAKSTTAVNLAAGLALRKRRVLLVDLDSQASASLSVGITKNALSPSIADVILRGLPVHQAIRPVGVDGLDIITGSADLANADFALANVKGREHRLRTVLAGIDEYQAIIIDSPPSLGILSINALTASSQIIIPTTPNYLSLEGLADMMDVIDRGRRSFGSDTTVMGILLTMVDRRARSTTEIIDMIRGHYGHRVFDAEIRVNIRLAEAPSFGQDIFRYAPTSTGAICYQQLVDEVIRRIKQSAKG